MARRPMMVPTKRELVNVLARTEAMLSAPVPNIAAIREMIRVLLHRVGQRPQR